MKKDAKSGEEKEREEKEKEKKKMTPSEHVPLWNTVTQPLATVLDMAFGCHHGRLSRVFTLNGHSYKVCCDCGAKFGYSLETMSETHRHWRFPSLHLRARRRLRRRRLMQ